MRYLNSLFMVAAVLLLLAGCDSSATMNGSTNLTLNLKPEVNGSELSTSSSAAYDVNGATISFTSARMYLSEITLLESESISYTTDGEHITVPAKNDEDEDISHTVRDKIVLVKQDAGVNLYDLGAWPSGEYEGIRFKVGIAGTTNRIDPSQVPAEHPLSKQSDRNNHWNWNAGYLFLRMTVKWMSTMTVPPMTTGPFTSVQSDFLRKSRSCRISRLKKIPMLRWTSASITERSWRMWI